MTAKKKSYFDTFMAELKKASKPERTEEKMIEAKELFRRLSISE